MGNRRYPVLVVLFCAAFCLYAQDVSGASSNSGLQKSYFVEEGSDGLSLYQHLSWEAVEDILGFEFLLEKKDKAGKWVGIDKKVLKENSINVSLRPGKYRYRVSVINLLNQVELSSDYRVFDVRVAYQPEVLSVSVSNIYFDEVKSDSVTVSGKNLFSETVFTLVKNKSVPIPCSVIESDEDGKKIRLKLDFSRISPGTYSLVAKDPSGLYDNSHTMTFKFQKSLDVYFSLGYTFTAFIKNETFYRYFKSDIVPLGGLVRLAFIPLKRAYGHFGLGFDFSAMQLKNKADVYSLKAGFLLPRLNLIYVFPIIKHRLNFDLHLGGGAAFMIQAKFEYPKTGIKSPPYWFWGPSVNGGTALQVYLYKQLYAEFNLEHTIIFRKDFPKYIIQPSISLGWAF